MSASTAPLAVDAARPAPRRPRGRAAFAVVAAVLLGLTALDVLGELVATSATTTTAFPRTVGHLGVVGGAGDVEVRTGPAGGDELVVRTVVRDGWSRASTSAEVVDGVLQLSSRCGAGGWLSPCSVSYVVTVPEDPTLSLDVRTGTGDQRYRGAFASVQAHLGTGDLVWSEAVGERLAVSGGSGDVAVAGEVADVAVRTGTGDVVVVLERAPDRVDVRAGTGDALVQVPDGAAYRVDVGSGTGDERIAVPVDAASARELRVSTSTGDATALSR